MNYSPYREPRFQSVPLLYLQDNNRDEDMSVGTVNGFYDFFKHTLTVEWKIPHYRRYLHIIMSPTFGSTTCPNYDHTWHLAIHPNGSKRAYPGYVSLYLYNDDHTKTPEVKLTMSVTRMYEKMSSSHKQTHDRKEFSCHAGGFGFHNFITKLYLLDPDSCFISADDTLTIKIKIKHYQKDSLDPAPVDSNALVLLSQEMDRMYHTDHQFKDVILEVDGQEIRAHKSHLSARSPVFKAMFEAQMEESETNRVHIEDVEFEVMQAVIKYIYSGNVDENIEGSPFFVIKLFAASDKYQVEYLRSMCEAYICNNLSPEVVVSAMITGHLHDSRLIKNSCFEILPSLNVKELQDWPEVCKMPDLLNEMIAYWQETGIIKPTAIN